MERLTKYVDSEAVVSKIFDLYFNKIKVDGRVIDKVVDIEFNQATAKLAAYEDTGKTPEEVDQLKQAFNMALSGADEQNTIINELQAENERLKADCDRWKARSEALELAIKKSASPCNSCDTTPSNDLSEPCSLCREGDASGWQFDEARFNDMIKEPCEYCDTKRSRTEGSQVDNICSNEDLLKSKNYNYCPNCSRELSKENHFISRGDKNESDT